MARPRKSIPIGTVIHKLTVIEAGPARPTSSRHYRSTSVCRCECGATKTIDNSKLLGGSLVSCGCWGSVAIGFRAVSHGLSVGEWKGEYTAWTNMMHRCYSEKCSQFFRYGGRGIAVCERWQDVRNFVLDMGRKPSRFHSLDRIDNEQGYSPDNCRWADKRTQAENRRSSVMFTVDGLTLCVRGWSRHWGVSRYIARKRLEAMQCSS